MLNVVRVADQITKDFLDSVEYNILMWKLFLKGIEDMTSSQLILYTVCHNRQVLVIKTQVLLVKDLIKNL